MKDCSKTSIGKLPIMDMTDGERYEGYLGGLYGNGSNIRSEPFNSQVLAASELIIPNPINNKIDMLFIGDDLGNSMATGVVHVPEWSTTLRPEVRSLNCTTAARHLESWAGVPLDGSGDFVWFYLLNKLSIAGWNTNDIQVLLFGAMPTASIYFTMSPVSRILYVQDKMNRVFLKAKQYLPNTKLLFIFGGHPYLGYFSAEPFIYDCDFGVQQAILNQNYSGVLSCWGRSCWSDGLNPRLYDNLTWECADFGDNNHLFDPIGNTHLAQRVLLPWLQSDDAASSLRA